MKQNYQRTGGYSLIEMLIYTTIVALLAVSVVESFLPLSRLYANLALSAKLNASGTLALERIVREVRRASDIAPGSTLGISPGALVLTTTDAGGSPTTLTFSVASSTLMLQEGAGAPYAQTGEGVVVSRLLFYGLSNATTSEMVSVDMELSATKGSITRVLPLRASVLLRNAY